MRSPLLHVSGIVPLNLTGRENGPQKGEAEAGFSSFSIPGGGQAALIEQLEEMKPGLLSWRSSFPIIFQTEASSRPLPSYCSWSNKMGDTVHLSGSSPEGQVYESVERFLAKVVYPL